MSTLNENLNKIYECKQDIGRALTEKGVAVKGFETYADGIRSIEIDEADKVRKLGACIFALNLLDNTLSFYTNSKEMSQSGKKSTPLGSAFSDGNKVVIVVNKINTAVVDWYNPKVSKRYIYILSSLGSIYAKQYIYNDNINSGLNNIYPTGHPLGNKELYLMDAETYTIVCIGLTRCENAPEIKTNFLPIKVGMGWAFADYVGDRNSTDLGFILKLGEEYTLPVDTTKLSIIPYTNDSETTYPMMVCVEYPFKERTN